MFTPLIKRVGLRAVVALVALLFIVCFAGGAAAQEAGPVASQTDAPAIVGGQLASPGEWPWQVALVFAGGDPYWDQYCGGSLIAPAWVLTAAHCVTGDAPADIQVLAGIHNLSYPEAGYQRINVAAITIHPSYNASSHDNDLAVLKLARAATLGPTSGGEMVATVPLVAANAGDLAGQMSAITGWGNTGNGYPDRLMEASVPVVTNAVCNASYGSITANMLCAGYEAGGVDTCQGDSGGPLVVGGPAWKLAGITSWGIGCAQPDYYGVYTRVSRYVAWINAITGQNQATDPHEPNNRRADATPISYGTQLTDPLISPAGDVDVYSFVGAAGDTAGIYTAIPGASPADTYLELMKSDGTVIASNDDDFDGDPAAHLVYTLPAAGTYYIKVREAGHPNVGGSTYAYSIRLEKVVNTGQVYVTTTAAGTVDGLPFEKRDVLQWNGSAWLLFFDGSAKGVPATADISAFYVANADTGAIVAGFLAATALPGAGTVAPHDLALYDQNGWSVRFDGSDVGLTLAGEKIDAVQMLGGGVSPIGSGCLRYLLLSTAGTGSVPKVGGGTLAFSGEDVLGFCATQLGATTKGVWHMVLDGSAEGLSLNATYSLSSSDDAKVLYLTTKGTFAADGVSGGPSMVYKFDRNTGAFSGPVWKAADYGLGVKVDGLDVKGPLP